MGLSWINRPANLDLSPLYLIFAEGCAFATFLLVVVVGCFVFLRLQRFKSARDLCLLGGGTAILVWTGLVALPEPSQIIHDPGTVSLGIGLGLVSPLGVIALALLAGGIALHFARRNDIVK